MRLFGLYLERPQRRGIFVGRTGLTEAFQRLLMAPRGAPVPVLVYFGIGGSGKTYLLDHLTRSYCQHTAVPWAKVDFRVSALRSRETALFSLRHDLSERHGFRFPRFDLICRHYRRRTGAGPEITTADSTIYTLRTFAQAGGIFSSLFEAPFKIADLLQELVRRWPRLRRRWIAPDFDEWIGRTRDAEPLHLLEMLPEAFATDVNVSLAKDRGRGQGRAVLVFDTYEQLWEQGPQGGEGRSSWADQWMRDLCSKLEGVLVVVAGRRRLRWDEMDVRWKDPTRLQQHSLGSLSEVDADTYLRMLGISSPQTRMSVTAKAKGYPLLLGAAAGLAARVRRHCGREPLPTDFDVLQDGDEQRELARWLLRFLPDEEADALSLLSMARWFDERIFDVLAKAFGLSRRPSLFAAIARDELVQPVDQPAPGFVLHEMARDCLGARLPEARRRQAHELLASAFRSRWPENDLFIAEYFHHLLVCDRSGAVEEFLHMLTRPPGLTPLSGRELRNVILDAGSPWSSEGREGALHLLARAAVFEAGHELEESSRLYEEARMRLVELGDVWGIARCLLGQGRVTAHEGATERADRCLTEAVEIADDYLARAQRACAPDEPALKEMAALREECMGARASMYARSGRVAEALSMFEQLLVEARSGENVLKTASWLSELGMVCRRVGQLDRAERHYNEAFEMFESAGRRAATAHVLCGLGMVSEQRGDASAAQAAFVRAQALFRQERDERGVEKTCHCLGRVQDSVGRRREALTMYRDAVGGHEAPGLERQPGTVLLDRAHALAELGQYDAAVQSAAYAAADFSRGTDRYGEATSRHNLAILQTLSGQSGEAAEQWARARQLWEECGISPPDRYGGGTQTVSLDAWLHWLRMYDHRSVDAVLRRTSD